MKRLITLVLGSAMAIGVFAACDQTEPATSQTSSNSSVKEVTNPEAFAIELPPSPADSIKNRSSRKLAKDSNVFPPGGNQ